MTPVSALNTVTFGEDVLQSASMATTGLVCSHSHSVQLKPVKNLGTPQRGAKQPPLIAFAAGELQQVHFPIWIDNICGLSLFAKRFSPSFFSTLFLSITLKFV